MKLREAPSCNLNIDAAQWRQKPQAENENLQKCAKLAVMSATPEPEVRICNENDRASVLSDLPLNGGRNESCGKMPIGAGEQEKACKLMRGSTKPKISNTPSQTRNTDFLHETASYTHGKHPFSKKNDGKPRNARKHEKQKVLTHRLRAERVDFQSQDTAPTSGREKWVLFLESPLSKA